DHIMAYLVKPVTQAHVEAAVTLAMMRFEQYQAVRQEARDLRQALEDRKLIERAKGAGMRRLRLDEPEAVGPLRRRAHDQNCQLVAAGQGVLASGGVFRALEGLAPAGSPHPGPGPEEG